MNIDVITLRKIRLTENPYKSPATTDIPERKGGPIQGASTFLGILVLTSWLLFFGMVGGVINSAVSGGPTMPDWVLPFSWIALGLLQFVAIFIMYRDGSRIWLAIISVITSGYCVTTFLVLLT